MQRQRGEFRLMAGVEAANRLIAPMMAGAEAANRRIAPMMARAEAANRLIAPMMAGAEAANRLIAPMMARAEAANRLIAPMMAGVEAANRLIAPMMAGVEERNRLIAPMMAGVEERNRIVCPRKTLTDSSARADFYVRRRFKRPRSEERLDTVDLRHEPPPLVSPLPDSDDDEDEGFVLINEAQGRITKLEMRSRCFIDEQMTVAFGPDWPKRRLPNGMYDKWQEKKRKAQQGGRGEDVLIAYADFTDYERVICKRDNWSVFKPFFGRKEDVRESFQRLCPVRVATMHARQITQDDALLLYLETRRLWKAMNSSGCLLSKL